MATELELKLACLESPDQTLLKLETCLKNLGIDSSFAFKRLGNIYFDTPDYALNQSKVAFRIRTVEKGEGARYIQTLKTKGESIDGMHRRNEWEWDIEQPEIDARLLSVCEGWPSHFDISSLGALFETNFKRHMLVFEFEGAKLELAYDVGEVKVGELSQSINEIEIELVSGEASAIKVLGGKLSEVIKLAPSDLSKAQRGFALL